MFSAWSGGHFSLSLCIWAVTVRVKFANIQTMRIICEM